MSDEPQIDVTDFAKKLAALKSYARSHPNESYRTLDNSTLAQVISVPGHREVTGAMISKANPSTEGEYRRLTLREHRLLLQAFGVEWPCHAYFDLEGRGRDKDVEAFRQWLDRKERPIRLKCVSSLKSNMPLYADRELFVFNLQDRSQSRDFLGVLIVKPAQKSLVVEGGDLFLGDCIATYGIEKFTLRVRWDDGVKISGVIIESGEATTHAVRDRSADDDFALLVERRRNGRHEPIRYLDGEFEVASLSIREMGPSDTVTIEALALLPSIDPHIPPEVQLRSPLDAAELKLKIRKIVQAKIVERYADSPSARELGASGMVLGFATFKTRLDE